MELVITAAFIYWLLQQRPVFERDLVIGDHILCGHVIQHHGIWVGNAVVHFDRADVDVDAYYMVNNCGTCAALRGQAPGGRSVRLSCLQCFSHNSNVYVCKYESGVASMVYRELGSRSSKRSLRGEEVARLAMYYYHNNNFGTYNPVHCNCEDFARWCKINEFGSKQVTRVIMYVGLMHASLFRTGAAKKVTDSIRKIHENSLRRTLPV